MRKPRERRDGSFPLMQTTRSGVCASRASGEMDSFRSCKRRGAAYAQAARAARWIISTHANDAERRMRKPRERRYKQFPLMQRH